MNQGELFRFVAGVLFRTSTRFGEGYVPEYKTSLVATAAFDRIIGT